MRTEDQTEVEEPGAASLIVTLRYSGRVELTTFTPENADIRDIAHGLALTNRWNGHTVVPVSVGWHSLLVSELCASTSRAAALHGLLHDAAEAYIGDWTQPVKKHATRWLRDLADRIETCCLAASGIDEADATHACVKAADTLALIYEEHAWWGIGRELGDDSDIQLQGIVKDAARRVAGSSLTGPITSHETVIELFIRRAARLMGPASKLQHSVKRWEARTGERGNSGTI